MGNTIARGEKTASGRPEAFRLTVVFIGSDDTTQRTFRLEFEIDPDARMDMKLELARKMAEEINGRTVTAIEVWSGIKWFEDKGNEDMLLVNTIGSFITTGKIKVDARKVVEPLSGGKSFVIFPIYFSSYEVLRKFTENINHMNRLVEAKIVGIVRLDE